MDLESSLSGSPTPLQVVSPDRINHQRESALFSSGAGSLGFDSSTTSVTDKISQFNTLATQSKHLERKTADAALKRAMLGREEAETEMRRCRDEVRQLRKQMEEGRERERRVGERLETVMENYGRSKETHAHTQALWEKEIRRARKETFKSQSTIVKLQEELKSARTSTKAAEESLEHEKQRSKLREQEAFQARYELVGCQEQLAQTLQSIKVLEQERDAFKSLAKSEEEVVRMASEGRLPLPPPDEQEEAEGEQEETEDEAQEGTAKADKADTATHADGDTEADTEAMTDSTKADVKVDTPPQSDAEQLLALPKTRRRSAKPRLSSLSLVDIRSSAASEAEIDELTQQWQWEKQRADRASELVEYLEAECLLRACSCMRKRPRPSMPESARKRPALGIDADGAGERMVLGDEASILTSQTAQIRASMQPMAKQMRQDGGSAGEDVFRTVSQQISDAMQQATATTAAVAATAQGQDRQDRQDRPEPLTAAVAGVNTATGNTADEPIMYARSPSAEPPSFAVLARRRTSLLSLLNAPHRQDAEPAAGFRFPVPTTSAAAISHADMADTADTADKAHVAGKTTQQTAAAVAAVAASLRMSSAMRHGERGPSPRETGDAAMSYSETYLTAPEIRKSDVQDYMELDGEPARREEEDGVARETREAREAREAAAAATYAVTTTVTRVPLREETAEPSLAQRLMAAQRTPTQTTPTSGESSFDSSNPALTPTMTREQCLEQIRERRGRARSATGGQRTARSGSVSSMSASASASGSGNAGANTSGSRGRRSGAAVTPAHPTRRPVTPGGERRDASGPMGRTSSVRRR